MLSMKLFALSVLLGTSALWAQDQANLTGTVMDSTGAVLPQASVRLISREQGTVRTAQTNGSGVYQFSFITPGGYDVTISAGGFKTVTRTNLVLAVAQSARVDLTLELGNASESVTVTAGAEAIDTESAQLGAVVDNTRVVEMPLNGRTFFSLAILTPNVMPPVQGSGLGYRGGFNVAGSCEGCNNFSLNGFDNNDNTKAIPNFRPSIDAIQEFNLLTGIYPAQYGYATGGQVVVTTKSGSNSLHGTGYEFLRNQVMDARNFFSRPGPLPAFKRNQFGMNMGGPIRKDRTFFFMSYEGLRVSQGITNVVTVPTAAMINGDFSTSGRTIKDPNGGNFPNNVIPPSRINAVGRGLLGYYPAPTSTSAPGVLPANNYTFNQARNEEFNEGSVKLDHSFSPRDMAMLTGNFYLDRSREPQVNSCGSTFLPGFACNLVQRSEVFGISETHIFSPSMVNELRYGWSLTIQPAISEAAYRDFWGNYGIVSTLLTLPSLPHLGPPQTTITGFNNIIGPSSFRRADPHYQVSDAFSWTLGKHAIKFGGGISHFATNNANVGKPTGTLTFTNTSTGPTSGFGLADVLLGLPATSGNQDNVFKLYLRQSNFNLYAQDDWKVLPNLTLNLGLRWELNTPPTDQAHHLTNFDVVKGIAFVEGTNGYGNTLISSDWKDFAPRFGFAWQPFHNARTVLRGGTGVFFNNPSYYNGLHDIFANYPLEGNATYTSSLTQPLSLSNPFPTKNAISTPTPLGINPHFINARVYEWSVGAQRQLGKDMVLELTYFGTSGSHLNNRRNINQPLPGAGTAAQVQARRPFPQFGTLNYTSFDGNSHYNSLQSRIQKQYGYGLSFLFGYTYGHSIDDVGASQQCGCGAGVTNAYDYRTARGFSAFDVHHRVVFSPVYELPFGKGRKYVNSGPLAWVIGDWQLSTLFQWQTGSPLTPTLSGNFSNSGGTTDRPDAYSNPNSGAPQTPDLWFNTASFLPLRATSAFQFGNAGKGIILSPGLVNADISIVRAFHYGERYKAEFRAEFFNSVNHANFGFPGVVADTASFGKISSAQDPRQTQLALKLFF